MTFKLNKTQKINSVRLISSAQMKTKTTHVKSVDVDAKSSVKFKCPHCQFLDADKDSVKRHIVSEHKLKPFGCFKHKISVDATAGQANSERYSNNKKQYVCSHIKSTLNYKVNHFSQF